MDTSEPVDDGQFRIEFCRGASCTVLERVGSVAAGIDRLMPFLVQLRTQGQRGELLLRVKDSSVVLARHAVWPETRLLG